MDKKKLKRLNLLNRDIEAAKYILSELPNDAEEVTIKIESFAGIRFPTTVIPEFKQLLRRHLEKIEKEFEEL